MKEKGRRKYTHSYSRSVGGVGAVGDVGGIGAARDVGEILSSIINFISLDMR